MKLIFRFYKLKGDYRAVTNKIRDDKDDKRGQYTKFTDKQRFEIGRYANQNGPAAPVRSFLKTFQSLNDSTVRSFRKLYEASFIIAARDNVSPPKAIVNNKGGRPIMLCQVDELVQRFLQATIQKWCC